ncbi:MarR family winged helix-turn-helix transcriptional regulator [Phenylobacterium aquaticum]|uniref:MarR family winged helix-turn-helix transcriptional regulator n=1 Tax=Phenylobacterium aquaticum TaxID=1763816 RepID=UPI001F5C4223|nr:MarR family winged helix-turn-helix transcriptional regulator [Phenylobacterium aquaticum]MCI3134937.1 MarR family winged helix-turn-helix transcriptional regulator [Phenylobacterium aquaticum]
MTDTDLPPDDALALALAQGISSLMRQFKLEPGLLAGSVYADLHVNDVGLLVVLAEPGDWTVRGVAQQLDAPDSTVSSALDRLEARGLIARRRRTSDRRVMGVEVTEEGAALAARLRAAQLDNSRQILARLSPKDRETMVRLITEAAAADGR